MDCVIRPMTIDDRDAVVDLWRRTEGIVLSETDELEPMRRFLDRNPELSLVAHHDTELVAAALCSHDGRRGYLHHLAVGERSRRRGIGSALVREALLRLSRHGIRKCNIFILPENRQGVAFWQRNGFRLLPHADWMQATTPSDD